MFLKTAHHSTIFFIFLVISIFSLFFLLFSPIKAEQVTRLIPAPGFTPITSSSPPINTASFPAPSVNPGEKVIGVYAFIHDGGTSWSFTPTVRFQDGSEGNLIVGCKANTDQGKYGDGVYDVCTGSGDPTIKHYLTLTGTETRQIESVRFFF